MTLEKIQKKTIKMLLKRLNLMIHAVYYFWSGKSVYCATPSTVIVLCGFMYENITRVLYNFSQCYSDLFSCSMRVILLHGIP